ncbi:hypothetical protein D8882_09980 [Streptococcus sanguinis]|uniref:hypothetical protein n=1 Tax=Streptococcus sanguinis TaxID=1305 RepID=UPI000FA32D90|nr:hypothetical protein [Streptococcus sanguinis]RSI16769.1 hypothetical protein D8882_09980 [Streptococcus sanguinis]
MGLFNFGKPKDEVLEAKLKKLTSDIEAKKSDLANLKQEIRTSKEIISLDAELILKKEELRLDMFMLFLILALLEKMFIKLVLLDVWNL